MKRIKSFIGTTLIGGLTVTLPMAMMWVVFNWLFGIIANFIRPAARYLTSVSEMNNFLSSIIVLGVILFICFGVGILVRTQIGNLLIAEVEKMLFLKIPGYTMVKETINQLMSKDASPFSQVALVRLHNSPTWATAFVTDRHEDGDYTVFVPCGPNPTTGFIYHLPGSEVRFVDQSVEETMRSILSCGAGSKKAMKKFKESGHRLT